MGKKLSLWNEPALATSPAPSDEGAETRLKLFEGGENCKGREGGRGSCMLGGKGCQA